MPEQADGQLKGLLARDRRERIAQLLQRQRFVRVDELSQMFQVSEVTIRNDLDSMEKQRLLVRDHGGALANSELPLTVGFGERAVICAEEKRRIGEAAAKLVNPGDIIILDAGTTVMEMARSLAGISPLTVVTGAMNVATLMGSYPDVSVIVIGGSLERNTISTYGAMAERNMSDLVAQKVFLGIHAFELETGMTDTSIDIVQVKRAMVRAAREVIVLADSTKWARVAFVKVAPLAVASTIITDSNLPAEARSAIADQGINLIVA
ncbi:MAG: DeoR/GlpR family DNA-binding transcription regulator [Thermomicrobiales bacterium]